MKTMKKKKRKMKEKKEKKKTTTGKMFYALCSCFMLMLMLMLIAWLMYKFVPVIYRTQKCLSLLKPPTFGAEFLDCKDP